ncbi:MAG: YigZ family protein [Oscillospiraceae bacterium]|jgi:uncharacterized YigZ family protein|nr:YigZ family protein [Oscillospiraceae bacterium]
MSEDYLTPAAYGEAELIEKRSRFIGRVWPVESEAEALEHLKEIRARHWDATHNVYAYILREGGTMRYSDDGEPQGTSGMPTLTVFRAKEIQNVLCVVTRYFGGILLGTGGLVRAYSQTAKMALAEAGIARVREWEELLIAAPYGMYEKIRRELELAGAVVTATDFGADVSLEALLEKGKSEALNRRLQELSSGEVEALILGSKFRAVRLDQEV